MPCHLRTPRTEGCRPAVLRFFVNWAQDLQLKVVKKICVTLLMVTKGFAIVVTDGFRVLVTFDLNYTLFLGV